MTAQAKVGAVNSRSKQLERTHSQFIDLRIVAEERCERLDTCANPTRVVQMSSCMSSEIIRILGQR
jgi:hypothetical protein